MSELVESHVRSSLLLTMISDFHELFSSLSLAIYALQDALFVSLEDAESGLERLQHARVLVLDSFGQDQRVEAA